MVGYKVGWVNGVVGKVLEEGGVLMLLFVFVLNLNVDGMAFASLNVTMIKVFA